MRRLLSLAALGVVAAGFMLATPATSQAQGDCGYGGYNAGYYDRGYGGAYGTYGGGYVNRGFSPGYGGYDASYSRGYAPGYGGHGVIRHPTSSHWTPDIGRHTHGHIHVPHRGHYHTRPY